MFFLQFSALWLADWVGFSPYEKSNPTVARPRRFAISSYDERENAHKFFKGHKAVTLAVAPDARWRNERRVVARLNE
jgi:hypothetical protein